MWKYMVIYQMRYYDGTADSYVDFVIANSETEAIESIKKVHDSVSDHAIIENIAAIHYTANIQKDIALFSTQPLALDSESDVGYIRLKADRMVSIN